MTRRLKAVTRDAPGSAGHLKIMESSVKKLRNDSLKLNFSGIYMVNIKTSFITQLIKCDFRFHLK